ncbi:MAG: hypothetical protein JW910_01225 [Anaerolineae bacterium]|nr:hypothetical protein [Anaerolineae bacterium]
MSGMITPRYNLMLTYDIAPDQEEAFYRFALSEFVPGMQSLGLYLIRAWHTIFGEYPIRQSEFVAENLDTIWTALESEKFVQLEERLLGYVSNYHRKVVHFSDRFQF